MKRPYFDQMQRTLIRCNTTKGAFMLLHLAFMKLINRALRPTKNK